MIDGYDGFTALAARIWTKAEKIDMTNVHRVAKEPFVTKYLKGIDAGLSASFVRTGSVAIPGAPTVLTGPGMTRAVEVAEDQTIVTGAGGVMREAGHAV